VIIVIVGNEDLMDIRGLKMHERQLSHDTITRIDEVRCVPDDQQIGRLGPLTRLPRPSLGPEQNQPRNL
jgi:hypothetical protein